MRVWVACVRMSVVTLFVGVAWLLAGLVRARALSQHVLKTCEAAAFQVYKTQHQQT